MNQQAINKDLAENDSNSSEWQKKVIESVRKYMSASANKMQTYHTGWDANSYIYRGYRVNDKDDVASLKEGIPPKVIVPITYAQVQTAISFILSTYTQRDSMFELRGTGPEDERNSFALTTDLSYQLNDQKFILKLYFWLLDALKQGFGVVRVEWKERYVKMRVAKQVPDNSMSNIFGAVFGKKVPMKTEEAVESVLSYQGNTIRNISPYAFYPDPSCTIANFQDGQFVFVEDETALASIESLEGQIYFGTKKIPKSISKDLFEDRPRRVSGPFGRENVSNPQTGKEQENRAVIRTEGEITMSQKRASELWGANFGTGEEPIKWMVTLANDQKIIRFEPSANLHGRYGFELFEFSPDHDSFFNPGLADTIGELQNIITFFLNSHIVNVKKIIANRFIADPSKVHVEDIESGAMLIRTKGAQGDIRRAVEQLAMSDVTKGHVADMGVLTQLVSLISGVNENATGQYSTGRRSATEARNVNAGSAARLKMHATLAWLQGIEPCARQFLANTRQWRTKDVYDSIVGGAALDAPFELAIYADPKKLAGGYDFVPYDATLPTDRQFQAGVLQELFTVLVQNPNTISLLNKDPIKLLEWIAQLYNIRNIRDFDLRPLGPPGPTLPTGGGPQVVPDEQAQQAAEGGAQPVDISGDSVLKSLIGG